MRQPMRYAGFRLASIAAAIASAMPQFLAGQQPELLLRLDDVGMNRAVNAAIERVAKTDIPFSASVLFIASLHHEAVAILRRYPHISVGVHLALNSEWRGYGWRPVLAGAVATLVNDSGHFVHSTAEFLARKYDLAEVERELSAQVERALATGLRIDYVDYHMRTAIATPELRAVVERVAAKYALGVSGYFGETWINLFAVPPQQKSTVLTSRMRALPTDRPTVVVIHVAEDTPEMRALVDMNNATMNAPTGEGLTYKHRHAELEMLLSPDLGRALRETGARLVTYRDLIGAKGLPAMRRPD